MGIAGLGGTVRLGGGLIRRPTRIISGGQTGADLGGLVGARRVGIATGGTAPKRYRTDAGPQPAVLRGFGLVEHRLAAYPPRTEDNVRNSSATVLFGNLDSPGCTLTLALCEKHRKPVLKNPTAHELRQWVIEHQTGDPQRRRQPRAHEPRHRAPRGGRDRGGVPDRGGGVMLRGMLFLALVVNGACAGFYAALIRDLRRQARRWDDAEHDVNEMRDRMMSMLPAVAVCAALAEDAHTPPMLRERARSAIPDWLMAAWKFSQHDDDSTRVH